MSAAARRWLALASDYVIAQVAIQALGLVASVWLINTMSLREYALYTLSLSAMAFLSVFSDLGVGVALVHFKRESARAGASFAPYVSAALQLRAVLFAIGLAPVSVFLFRSGLGNGFAGAEIAVAVALVGIALWFQIGASVRVAVLRLDGAFRPSYAVDLAGAAARLATVAAVVLLSTLSAWGATLTNVVGAFASRVMASHGESRFAVSRPEQASARRDIVRYIAPLSLNAMYFAIQGPLTVWLAAHYADTATIAQIGALGRLGVLLGLVSGFAGTVFLPQLAHVADEAAYLRRYLAFWAILLAIGALVLALTLARPDLLLALLGSEYRDLRDGVFLTACIAVVTTWGAYAAGVNHARGWVAAQPAALLVYAAAQMGMIATLDFSNAIGVLRFGLWSAIVGWMLQALINAGGFVRDARKRRQEGLKTHGPRA